MAVGGKSMHQFDDDAELMEALRAAAELLLPVAGPELSCPPAVSAWLADIRDMFDPDRVVH